MKCRVASNQERGFSRWDLLILVVVVLGLLAALLVPTLASAKAKSRRISCVCNLKQIGLALRMWSNEWGGKFPWQLATTNGGTGGWLGPADVFRHFRTISNELTTPKVLVCLSDRVRRPVSRWKDFAGNKHLSYFIGLDADETRPQTILSGDRSISTNGYFLTGLVLFYTNSSIQWAAGIHGASGNIGLGDGSVQQMTTQSVQRQAIAASNEFVRLLIP